MKWAVISLAFTIPFGLLLLGCAIERASRRIAGVSEAQLQAGMLQKVFDRPL